MPVRRRTARRVMKLDDRSLVAAFAWACDDSFTENFFSERTFATTAEAQRVWPRARRVVWAQTHRMALPRAAEVFDGLTRNAWELVWRTWNNVPPFPIADVLAALEDDREKVLKFEQRDPDGAREIADYLQMWRTDLATIEAVALELVSNQWGGGIHRLSSASRYGAAFARALDSGESHGNV